jgi:1,4-alpha-glucan branching enzyme
VLAPTGVAFFGRDPDVARAVWSRATGYPGDPLYRDFYRDLGFDLDVAELEGEVGPNGTRVMTGLKLHRVSGEGAAKAPYDPDLALDRAHDHAAHFVAARREELLARTRALGSPASSPLVSVAPFDAELFGHWWFEGPDFLERTLRLLATDPSIRATTLGAHLEAHPDLAVVEPAASTWGEGGFGDVWMGPRTARLLRPLHHAASTVLAAVRTSRDASGVAGHALDQSIREILLAQASDWPFMIHRGEMSEYAHGRVRIHSERAVSLARIATNAARGTPPTQADVALLHDIVARDRAFFELRGERLRAPFDLTA